MELKFEIELNYETSQEEINDDDYNFGLDEIKKLFYDYYKIGIIPRIGEMLIPMNEKWNYPVIIKSICYCEHKIMIQCDFC